MKRTLFIAPIALTILAVAFFVSPSSSAGGLTKSKAAVTFNKDVAPILFKNCAECHRPGEAAPMSLLSYKETRPWARSIREKVVSREMPPWHADPHVGQFSNDRRLTQAEIDTITAWVDGGAKEGEPRDLPPAPKFVEGWSIGQPDLILDMPEEFTLDANGPD
ncbi:MAG: c-type cytochrome, partial [Blastocatellia bacterium]